MPYVHCTLIHVYICDVLGWF